MQKYDKKNLAAMNMASTDATRPNLNGIYFHEGKAVATNGSMLIVIDGIGEANGDPSFILPLDSAGLCKKLIKKNETFTVSLEAEENEYTQKGGFTSYNEHDLEQQTAGVIVDTETTYPDYKQVLSDNEGGQEIHLNPGMLSSLAKTAQQCGAKGITLRLHPSDPQNKAVYFQFNLDNAGYKADRKAEGAIMPMRK